MTEAVELDPTDTHALRRSVLRSDDPDASVDWPGDRDATTLHLGVIDDTGTVIAVSTWLDRPFSVAPGVAARQLRGMATDPALRGSGLGTHLLDEGVQRAFTGATEVVWANARVEAIPFYERRGWAATGPVFATQDTGLPHRLMFRQSSATPPG